MNPFETERLSVRELCVDDCADVLALLNTDAFIQHIGDKGVRTLEDARAYVADGPMASYSVNGFGLWRVATRAEDCFVGLCGFIRRAELGDVDIGYAFMPSFFGQGFGMEVARACLDRRRQFGIDHVVAIVSDTNRPSQRLLEKLGFVYCQQISFGEDAQELMFYRMLS